MPHAHLKLISVLITSFGCSTLVRPHLRCDITMRQSHKISVFSLHTVTTCMLKYDNHDTYSNNKYVIIFGKIKLQGTNGEVSLLSSTFSTPSPHFGLFPLKWGAIPQKLRRSPKYLSKLPKIGVIAKRNYGYSVTSNKGNIVYGQQSAIKTLTKVGAIPPKVGIIPLKVG